MEVEAEEKMKAKGLPAGTIILCPHCKREIYKLTAEVQGGMVMKAEMFQPINPEVYQPKDGDNAACPFCAKDFTKGLTRDFLEMDVDGIAFACVIGLYTRDGWADFK